MNAVLTATTCGLTCWMAQEDVCHCSCGGANHGCLRKEGGAQPVRQAKLQGVRCELKAVGNWKEIDDQARKLNQESGIQSRFGGLLGSYYSASISREPMFQVLPAKVRMASKTQVDAWPELTAYRGTRRPYLLWVKVE